jgi:putative ABC transport system permease protein
MISSILTLTFRNFFRNIAYSMITMSGLIVGLTTAILTFLWVSYELSYNNFHPDNDRVFAVLTNEIVEGEIITEEGTSAPMMDYFNDIPEVESATRIDNTRGVLTNGVKTIPKEGVYADTSFFQVHPTAIFSGDAARPFPDNYSIAIARELAQQLFENGDALGKTILIDRKMEFKVTAVYEPFPENSNFDYISYILPFDSKKRTPDDNWHNHDVKLRQAASPEAVEQKLNLKLKNFAQDKNITSLLFGLPAWRLHWNFENGKSSGGRIVFVIIFGVSALFILIMACINYMNIATARAAKRAREIGVRKMTGATQAVLVRQFMIESLILTFIATFVSLAVVYVLLPLFSQMTGVKLFISLINPVLLTGLFCIALFTGLLAGSYPALLLASFKPASVLKGNLYSGLTGAGLRRTLVVFQFALSIIMIFCSVVMWQQTNYLLKKDLGYDKHHVINIWLGEAIDYPFNNLKAAILSHSSVLSAAHSGASPMEVNGWEEANRLSNAFSAPVLLNGVNIDEDVIPLLKFEIVQGRNFSRDMASDSSNFIITQKAADALGFDNPIGQQISYNMFGKQKGEIIGVIKDFQNDDVHVPVRPVIFVYGKEKFFRNMFVRYQEGRLDAAIEHIKKVFDKIQPGIPINYTFLDADYQNQFFREKMLGNLSVGFTAIAIVIACLGLFGLTMFNAERRTKEIGIRKVLGASVPQMMVMLCKDFIRPIMVSFLLAFPIAYYLMEKFLASYASRIAIPVISFIVVGSAMIVLVLVTVSYQSFQAAAKNPVESLKSE